MRDRVKDPDAVLDMLKEAHEQKPKIKSPRNIGPLSVKKQLDLNQQLLNICQEQWKIDQEITTIENEMWKLKNKKLSCCDQKAILERKKTEIYVSLGLKKVEKLSDDEKRGKDAKPKTEDVC